VLAVVAAIAALAFGAARLFFARPVPAPDIPRSLDAGLKPLMLKQIRAENRLVETPVVTGAVSAIMDRLTPAYAAVPLEAANVPQEPPREPPAESRPAIEVLVVDSPVINAFTVPGGVVCIYTGLMKTLSSPEELAAILAHEMSHAAFRDPLTQLARNVGMATLASVLTGGQGETLAQGLLADLVSLRYGRAAEDRADEFAVALLAKAGIDPASYGSALSRIKGSNPKDMKLLRYLDPHSPIDERIRSAGERATAAAARAAAEGLKAKRIAVDWRKLLKALPSVLEPTD
jgi:predicted Zn-dependent protease